MKGGLLQLATVGKEDSVLINKPQIIHFKKVFMRYTHFSVDNNFRSYGYKKFDSNFTINFDKDGDLLKDIFFYIDIPYFQLKKKITTRQTTFDRTVSDKIYYDTLDYKTFVFCKDENTFYLIPETVLYDPKRFDFERLDPMDIIEVNSSDYNKYFSKKSDFQTIKYKDKFDHSILNHLKKIDSFWFNCFINQIIENGKDNDLNIVMMDYQKFSIWLKNKIDNKLFFFYQRNFNTDVNRDFIQVNTTGTNNRTVNETKKYFEIIDSLENINSTNYINENLDIDKAIGNLFTSNTDLTSTYNKTFLLNTVRFNSSVLSYLLNKKYDDTYTNNNYFTFYHIYTVANEVDNKILSLNPVFYQNKNWDNYVKAYFEETFENKDLDSFYSFYWNDLLLAFGQLEKNIENSFQTLNLKQNNKFIVDFIHSVIYTFVNRFESFTSFETVNFLDFFTKSNELTFEEALQKNYRDYGDIFKTDLAARWSTFKNKFDLSIMFAYYVYILVNSLDKLQLFENLDGISKQNIQFLYWWRNKIVNQVFLRYKRIQVNNRVQDFTNISNNDELVNFQYTYVPNSSLTREEIRSDLYQVFYNNHYYATIANDSNTVANFRTIEKISQVTNVVYDGGSSGIVTAEINISMLTSVDFTQNKTEARNLVRIDKDFDFYTNEKYLSSISILVDDTFYDVSSTFLDENGKLNFILGDNNITVDNPAVTFVYKFPVNKYYIPMTPYILKKSEIAFDSDNRTFSYDKYVNAEYIDFTLEKENSNVKVFFDLVEISTLDNTSTYKNKIISNGFMDQGLFSSDTVSNYTKTIFQEILYENTNSLTNFTITKTNENGQNIFVLKFLTTGLFTLTTTSIYYLIFDSVTYPVTIVSRANADEYQLSGITEFLLDSANVTDYKIQEDKTILTPTIFSLTGDISDNFSSRTLLNINDTDKTFRLNENLGITDSSNVLLLKDNIYYHVGIDADTGGVSGTFKVSNFTKSLVGATLIEDYYITYTGTETLNTASNYYLDFKLTADTITEKVKVEEVLNGPLTPISNGLTNAITTTFSSATITGLSGITSIPHSTSTRDGSGAQFTIFVSGSINTSSSITTFNDNISNATDGSVTIYDYQMSFGNSDRSNDTIPIGTRATITISGNTATAVQFANGGSGFFDQDQIRIEGTQIPGSSSGVSTGILKIPLTTSELTNGLVSKVEITSSSLTGNFYSEGEVLTISSGDYNERGGTASGNLTLTLVQDSIDLASSLTSATIQSSNYISSTKKFRYRLTSKNTTDYSDWITSASKVFQLVGYPEYMKTTIIYKRQNNAVIKNLFIKPNIITLDFINTQDFQYYLKVVLEDGTETKKKINFTTFFSYGIGEYTTSFRKINFNNDYEILDKVDITLATEVSIQQVRLLSNLETVKGKIVTDENNDFNVKISFTTDGELSYSDNVKNEKFYYKYVKDKSSTFYYEYGGSFVPLQYPKIVDSSNLTFKVLENTSTSIGYRSRVQTRDMGDINFRIFTNDDLPNLINYSSFYLQDKANRVSDLMDHFIQSPMVLFLDNNTTKNGNVILKNFPFNIDQQYRVEPSVTFIELDGQNLFLNEKLNSNQLIRFNNTLVSSSFDPDILDSFKFTKFDVIKKINDTIDTTLSKNKLREILATMESVDNDINSTIDLFSITNLENGTYGETIKKIFETVDTQNKLNKSFQLKKFNNLDYDLFSKKVLDFYSTYDTNIGINYTLGDGRDLFVTNYRPLLNKERLDPNMINYLNGFSVGIGQQIDYINDNKLWTTLRKVADFGSLLSNKFNYFYNFQQSLKDKLYLNEDKTYFFEFLNDDECKFYPELEYQNFIYKDNSYNTLTLTTDASEIVSRGMSEVYFFFNQAATLPPKIDYNYLNTKIDIDPVIENVNTELIDSRVSNYEFKYNEFNLLGPAVIRDGEIIESNIKYKFTEQDTTVDYFFTIPAYVFVDDCKYTFSVAPHSRTRDVSGWSSRGVLNGRYTDSYVVDISEVGVTIGAVSDKIFLYEFERDGSIGLGQLVLIDNILTRCISTNFGLEMSNIALISREELTLTNKTVLIGNVKTSYSQAPYYFTDASENLLKNNIVNAVDLSGETFLPKFIRSQYLNYSTTTSKNLFNGKYFVVNGRVLDFYFIDGKFFFYEDPFLQISDPVGSPGDEFYMPGTIMAMGNRKVDGLPLSVQGGLGDVRYHNIKKKLHKDTYIFWDNSISKLKNIDALTGPLKDVSDSTYFNVVQNTTQISATDVEGLKLKPTTDGRGSGAIIRMQVSGAVSGNLTASIITNTTSITSNLSATNLATTTNRLGKNCTVNITGSSSGTTVSQVTVNTGGESYMVGDLLTVSNSLISGSNTDLVIKLTAANITAAQPSLISVISGGFGYKNGDKLTITQGLMPGSDRDFIVQIVDPNVNIPREIWFFNGELSNLLTKISLKVNIETKQIALNNLNKLKNGFFGMNTIGTLKTSTQYLGSVTQNPTGTGSFTVNVSDPTNPQINSNWNVVFNNGSGSGQVTSIQVNGSSTGFKIGDTITISASNLNSASSDLIITLGHNDLNLISGDKIFYHLSDFTYSASPSGISEESNIYLLSDTAFSGNKDYYSVGKTTISSTKNYNMMTNTISPADDNLRYYDISENNRYLLDNNKERLYDNALLRFKLIRGPLIVTADNLLNSITTNTTNISASSPVTNVSTTTNGSGSGAILTIAITSGAVSGVTVTTVGNNYREGDTLTVNASSLTGASSNVVFTLKSSNIASGTLSSLENALLTSIVFNATSIGATDRVGLASKSLTTSIGSGSGGIVTVFSHGPLSTTTNALLASISTNTSGINATTSSGLTSISTSNSNTAGSGAILTLFASASIRTQSLGATITSNVSGATNGSVNVAASNVSPNKGATFTLTIAGNIVTGISCTGAGSGYFSGESLTISNTAIAGTSDNLVFTLAASDLNNTSITGVNVTTVGSGYAIGDILTVASSSISGASNNLVFTLVANDINTSGVTKINVTTPGSGYSVGDELIISNSIIPGSDDVILILNDLALQPRISGINKIISVRNTSATNRVNKLKYKLFTNPNFTGETSSVIKIPYSDINPNNNTLQLKKVIYLNFVEKLNSTPSIHNNLTLYDYDSTKVSYVNVSNDGGFLQVTLLDSVQAKFAITAPVLEPEEFLSTTGRHKALIPGQMYTETMIVDFTYLEVEYSFDLNINYIVDDNYRQDLLMKDLETTSDFVFLQEPFIVSNPTGSTDIIKDASELDFLSSTPPIFKRDTTKTNPHLEIIANNTTSLSSVTSFSKTVDYMDVSEGNFEIKDITINNNNDFVSYWELLAKVSLEKTSVFLSTEFYKYLDISDEIIIILDSGEITWMEVQDRTSTFLRVPKTYDATQTQGFLFVNFQPWIRVNRFINFNFSLNIITSEFGCLRPGEVIRVGGTDATLLIKDWNNELGGYSFVFIQYFTISLSNLNTSYDCYFTHGLLNNYSRKMDCTFNQNQKQLINKKNSELNFGDFIYNNKYIGFYDNDLIKASDDSLNFTFDHYPDRIFLKKIGTEWYYFGSKIRNDTLLTCSYNDSGAVKQAILEVSYIFRNIVYWKDPTGYASILNNLTNGYKNNSSSSNCYGFGLPCQPFEYKYLVVDTEFFTEGIHALVENGGLATRFNAQFFNITQNPSSIKVTTKEGKKNVPTTTTGIGEGAVYTVFVSGAVLTTSDALLTSIQNNTTKITTGTHTGLATTTDGNGTGCILQITASGNTSVTSITATTAGSGYFANDLLIVKATNIPGSDTDLVIRLKTDDLAGTKVTGLLATSAGSGYQTKDRVTINKNNIEANQDLFIDLQSFDLNVFCDDPKKKNGFIYLKDRYYLINNHRIMGFDDDGLNGYTPGGKIPSDYYKVAFFEDTTSVFVDTSYNVYDFKQISLGGTTFYRPEEFFYDEYDTLKTNIAANQFSTSSKHYIYYNGKYMYPVALSNVFGFMFGTSTELLPGYTLYHPEQFGEEGFITGDTPPSNYTDIRQPFYYVDSNSKYYYPLYLDINSLTTKDIKNDMKSISISAKIKPASSNPLIITSQAKTVATVGQAYSYQLEHNGNGLLSITGTISSPTDASNGTLIISSDKISTPSGFGAQLSLTIAGNSVTGITVLKPGSYYTSGETLTILAADIPNSSNGGASNSNLTVVLQTADIDTPIISVLGAPGWLSYNSTTRILSGTPVVGGLTGMLGPSTGDITQAPFNLVFNQTYNISASQVTRLSGSGSGASFTVIQDDFTFFNPKITVVLSGSGYTAGTQLRITGDGSFTFDPALEFTIPNSMVVSSFLPADISISITSSKSSTITNGDPYNLNYQNFTLLTKTANELQPAGTTSVITNTFYGSKYSGIISFNPSSSGTITSIKPSYPKWWDARIDGNSIYWQGIPSHKNLGENFVNIEVSDSNSQIINYKYSIQVHANNPPVITSRPPLTLTPNSQFSYALEFKDYDDVSGVEVVNFFLPAWVTYDSSTKTYSGTVPSTNNTSHQFLIIVRDKRKHYDTGEDAAFTEQGFDIWASDSPVQITSRPPANAFIGESYTYQITGVNTITGSKPKFTGQQLPPWITLTSDDKLYGTPSDCNTNSNKVELRAEDESGNVGYQIFYIFVYRNNHNSLVINPGVFGNILSNINLVYKSKIKMEGKYYTLDNIINYNDRSEIILNEPINVEKHSDLNQNVKVEFSIKNTYEREYSVNDHLVYIDNNLLNYRYINNDYNMILYCYYTTTSSPDQIQLRLFEIQYSEYEEFRTTTDEFKVFYEDLSGRSDFYIDNYVPIEIYSQTLVQTFDSQGNAISFVGYVYKFMKKQFDINKNDRVLIEELEKDGTRVVHNVQIKLENGFLKLVQNISNNTSQFLLNRILPIRLIENYIQIQSAIPFSHRKISVNNSSIVEKWVKVPVEILAGAVIGLNSWNIAFESKYTNLLERYPIFTDLPYNNPKKLVFSSVINPSTPTIKDFRLESELSHLPSVNTKFVYIKVENHFKKLEKLNNVWDPSLTEPIDKSPEDFLKSKWYYLNEKTKIPVTISETTSSNRTVDNFSKIIKNYQPENIYPKIDYYLDAPSIPVINSGTVDTGELETVLSEVITAGSSNLFYDTSQSANIKPSKKEPVMSVNTTIDYMKNFKIDTRICFNKSKSWKDWTSISFYNNPLYSTNNQLYIKTLKINSGGAFELVDESDNSVILFEENLSTSNLVTIGNLFLADNLVFSTFNTIRKVEDILFEFIYQESENYNFWESPIRNINKYLSSYKRKDDLSPPYYGFRVYKNCILTKDEYEGRIYLDTTKFRVVDDESIERIAYLDNQFIVSSFSQYITIKRYRNSVDREIEIFLEEQTNSYYGVDSHKLLRYVSKIYQDKYNFLSDILNGNSFGFDRNLTNNQVANNYDNFYDVFTPEKLIITKEWKKTFSNPAYKGFNADFTDKLQVNYTSHIDYDTEKNFYGVRVNNFGELENIGLLSGNQLNKVDFTLDKYIYYNTVEYINILDGRYRNIDYDLSGNQLYKYLVYSDDIINFNPEYSYKLDVLESNNLLKDESLNIYKFYDNGLEFLSNNYYKKFDDSSLKINKNYTITNSKSLGFLYQDVRVPSLKTDKIRLYVEQNIVTKESSRVDTTNNYTSFDLLSSVVLSNADAFKIELPVAIMNYFSDQSSAAHQQSGDGNTQLRTYLQFSSNFNDSNIKNAVDQNLLYIDLSSNPYSLKFDTTSNEYYILNTNYLENIDVSINYNIFGFFLQTALTSKKADFRSYEITLNENLQNYDYLIDKPLPLNVSILDQSLNDISLNNMKVLSPNLFHIQVANSIDFTERIPNFLKQTLNIDNNKYNLVTAIDFENSEFLIEILNNTQILSDGTITLKKENNPDITGVKYKDISGNNFLFRTSQFYTKNDLIGYKTEIVNILSNITSYTLTANKLVFKKSQPLSLSLDSNFSYSLDISGSYGLIDNSNIQLVDNNLQITLPNWDSYTPSTSFNFKQVEFSLKEFITKSDNQTCKITTSNNYLISKEDKIILKYLDRNNNEIGNYIYSFDPGTEIGYNISKTYKIEFNNESRDIFLIGILNNLLYFSILDKLDESSMIRYRVYSEFYAGTIIFTGDKLNYVSRTYYEGEISEVLDFNKFEINFKSYIEHNVIDFSNIGISDYSSNLILFPNSTYDVTTDTLDSQFYNANLYMSKISSKKSKLTLENLSNVDIKFPDELLYSNYNKITETTTEKIEELIWDREFAYKIFDYIDFYIDDQRIDRMDYGVYVASQMYTDRNMKLKPDKIGDSYRFYLPTFFWFKKDSANFLPIVSLSNSKISVRLKLNKLENLLENDLSLILSDVSDVQLDKKVKVDMLVDNIILDDSERRKFAEYNHEYLIQRFLSYPKVTIGKEKLEIPLSIKGLIKDVFWIVRSEKTNRGYITDNSIVRDEFFKDYYDASGLHKTYLDNNRIFGGEVTTDFVERFLILDDVDNIIYNNSNPTLLSSVRNHNYLKNFDTRFVLYLFYYRLSYWNNFEFESTLARDRRKFSKLVLYFKNVYKNELTSNYLQPIKNLTFKANGKMLLAETESEYYHSLVPVEKFERSAEMGNYMYSFSLYPSLSQPTGQLNFNILEDPTLELVMDPNVTIENVRLNTVIKEFQILRIIGGQGNLGWI